jgi:hypothetical protein
MGYRIRVLGTRDAIVTRQVVRGALEQASVPSGFAVEAFDEDAISELHVTTADGEPVCMVERNVVADGELGSTEIAEYEDEIKDAKPASAADWLLSFLPKVRVIYAIQVLSGSERPHGWNAIHAIQGVIWNAVGGILQADGEGFSNEDGYHILWQFSDGVKGSWQMAVLSEAGGWKHFTMDLGNRTHRKAFLAGRVPEGVGVD